MEPQWLKWAKELQAISQNGLNYSKDIFDTERYKRIGNIAAELMASNSDTGFEFINGLFSSQQGHATPKIDVRGVVFKDEKILLVKEVSDGCWTLPGGWADTNETPSESVEREVREESGLIVKAERLLAVYDRAKQGHTPPYPFHIYKIFFLCRLMGGSVKNSIETDGVDFFDASNIPNLSTSRTTEIQIKKMFEFLHNQEKMPEFD